MARSFYKAGVRVQGRSIQAKIAADMEAPPGPLRSPDGLWWWDGKAWQPIASLEAPPPPADIWQSPPEVAAAAPAAVVEEASAGAWQPPPGIGEPAAADPPSPTVGPEAVPAAESPAAWQPPPTAPPAPDSWRPPGATSEAAPAAGPGTANDSIWELPLAPAPAPAPAPAAASSSPPEPATPVQAPLPPPSDPPIAVYGPPPAVAPPAAASPPSPTSVAPPPPPPPPPAPPPPVSLPNWLPRSERSEAVVQGLPTRADPGAVKPPPPPASPAPVVQVPAGARPSGWVAQLYPAGAALNANRRLVAYVGLGILGLIAVYVLWQAVAGLNLFGGGATGTTPDNSPTGTQFAQADGFLVGSLSPGLASIATAVKPIPVDCTGAHSVTCRNSLEDADGAVVRTITVIDKGPFPGCLAASVVKTRRDLVNLDQALKTALIGFRYNDDSLVTRGLAEFTASAPTLKADGDALKASEISACPKTP